MSLAFSSRWAPSGFPRRSDRARCQSPRVSINAPCAVGESVLGGQPESVILNGTVLTEECTDVSPAGGRRANFGMRVVGRDHWTTRDGGMDLKELGKAGRLGHCRYKGADGEADGASG